MWARGLRPPTARQARGPSPQAAYAARGLDSASSNTTLRSRSSNEERRAANLPLPAEFWLQVAEVVLSTRREVPHAGAGVEIEVGPRPTPRVHSSPSPPIVCDRFHLLPLPDLTEPLCRSAGPLLLLPLRLTSLRLSSLRQLFQNRLRHSGTPGEHCRCFALPVDDVHLCVPSTDQQLHTSVLTELASCVERCPACPVCLVDLGRGLQKLPCHHRGIGAASCNGGH
mmetsp:Transcript_120735/g.301239  ORF Transcript_120735/g.301239 Transcript_120735/m.301239 type:complete len:226 (-) Transcript_120735:108-785(-)